MVQYCVIVIVAYRSKYSVMYVKLTYFFYMTYRPDQKQLCKIKFQREMCVHTPEGKPYDLYGPK